MCACLMIVGLVELVRGCLNENGWCFSYGRGAMVLVIELGPPYVSLRGVGV